MSRLNNPAIRRSFRAVPLLPLLLLFACTAGPGESEGPSGGESVQQKKKKEGSQTDTPRSGDRGRTPDAASVPRPGVEPSRDLFQPPIEPLSPEKTREHTYLAEGYRLEAALTEPHVREPVAVEFDGNGRMYVAEMRTYMQNVDGDDQKVPKSRISVHEDTDGDGTYDRHRVFAKDLQLPRMMLALREGELLVHETWNKKIVRYTDTDGDFQADETSVELRLDSVDANLEHQTSGFVWAANNWIYMNNMFKTLRFRWTPDGFHKESQTYNSGGQWGLTQDRFGKLWPLNAGAELGPVNYQQPVEYGKIEMKDTHPDTWRTVYPLCAVPDVQGGKHRVRKNHTLNHFTATSGPEVFRGDRLPASLRGDLLFAEPVGRLIRRAEISVKEGVTYLRNTYDGAEFIRSVDPLFRPVNLHTAPDGTLYIVDMYRGIIQESNWVRKGSYLRKKVLKYDLQDDTGRGRIWRLRHERFDPGPRPSMYDESPLELVEHLTHPNGWWRNMAQRLLILRRTTSDEVTSALDRMLRNHDDPVARFHALWTLEGLHRLTSKQIRTALGDDHPEVRRAAVRASESLLGRDRAGTKLRKRLLKQLRTDAHPGVRIQVMLTADFLGWNGLKKLFRKYKKGEDRPAGVRNIAETLYQRQ